MSSPLPQTVMILRHAHSSWALPGQRDHARPLDERGRREAEALGRRLAEEGPRPDVVVCSTANRARETLEAIRPALDEGTRVDFSDHLYALGVEAYFQAIAKAGCEGTLMLIGHNPMIEDFALAVTGAGEETPSPLRAGLPTCGLVLVAIPAGTETVGPGCGTLSAFQRPEKDAS